MLVAFAFVVKAETDKKLTITCEEAVEGFDRFECLNEHDESYNSFKETEGSKKFKLKRKVIGDYFTLDIRPTEAEKAEDDPLIQTLLKIQDIEFVPTLVEFDVKNEHLYLITRFKETKTIFQAIHDPKYFKSERHVLFFFSRLVHLIAYLKEKDILLTDINYDTILIGNNFHPYIYEFGSAIKYGTYAVPKSNFKFADPTQIKRWNDRALKFTDKNSIWSLGVLLYYITHKKLPFDQETKQLQLHFMSKTIELKKGLSINTARMIDSCLKYHKFQRIDILDLRKFARLSVLKMNVMHLERLLKIDTLTFLPAEKPTLLENLSELIFVVIIVFCVIPLVVFIVSRKAKLEDQANNRQMHFGF